MADSPRWCEMCRTYGDHHTDQHPVGAPGAVPYRLTMECVWALPRDLDQRQEMYGAIDPEACIKIDLENDPAMVMLEGGFTLVGVTEVEGG